MSRVTTKDLQLWHSFSLRNNRTEATVCCLMRGWTGSSVTRVFRFICTSGYFGSYVLIAVQHSTFSGDCLLFVRSNFKYICQRAEPGRLSRMSASTDWYVFEIKSQQPAWVYLLEGLLQVQSPPNKPKTVIKT